MVSAASQADFTCDNTHLSNPNDQGVDGTVAFDEVAPLQSIAIASLIPETVRQYMTAAIADNTRRAYQSDLADFYQWGGVVPCSPELLATYLSFRADTLASVTLTRRVVAISRAHSSLGLSDPAKTDLVRTVLRGIRRKNGSAQRQAQPLLKEDLLSIVPTMTGTGGLRDRALILLGFSAALRRSELVALDYTDLAFVNEGLLVNIRHSKTDQEGLGRRVGVPYGRTSACPVKALTTWLEHAAIDSGAVFRSVRKGGAIGSRLSAQAVAEIVKARAQAIGLQAQYFSGHSLRAGLVTSAAQAGIATHKIMQQTGHRSTAMVARYIRDANIFTNNAGSIL